jgi:hypothetical protein
MTPTCDERLRDAASLSLHWLRGDQDAVSVMLAGLDGPELEGMVYALLAAGNIAGVAQGGDDGEAYARALEHVCAVCARAAAGLEAV